MAKKNPIPPVSPEKTDLAPKMKGIPFHFNLIALVVSFLFVFFLYKNIPSYQWLKEELLKENLKIIKKHPKLSTDEKLQAKIGYDYAVVKMMRDATPETAIILMPIADTCLKIRAGEKAQSLNGGGIGSKLWCQYYLYPRKVVYQGSLDPDLPNADYVAVLAGHGYERINPTGVGNPGYAVLPLNSKQ